MKEEVAVGEVRHAREGDFPSIVEIHNAAIASRLATAQLDPVTVEGRREWFAAHRPDTYPLLVSEIEGEIAGWASAKEFLPRCAYRGTVELSVYVRERFRRRGIARRLLDQMIALGPSLGMHSFVGLIFAHNAPSIALFQAAGFVRWGLLPGIARMEDHVRDLAIFGRKL